MMMTIHVIKTVLSYVFKCLIISFYIIFSFRSILLFDSINHGSLSIPGQLVAICYCYRSRFWIPFFLFICFSIIRLVNYIRGEEGEVVQSFSSTTIKMNNHRVLFSIVLVMSLINLTVSSTANCPVEGKNHAAKRMCYDWLNCFSADPATILSCVAIDAVGLVQATKGNVRVFCTMAERFMECVKTKTRGCVGEEVRKVSFETKLEFFILVCPWIVNWINWTITKMLCQ